MTDELTDEQIDAGLVDAAIRAAMEVFIARKLTTVRQGDPDSPVSIALREALADSALVAALRSAWARPKYSGDWEEAEIALRDLLDADDALEVLQTLQGLGFASAAELERERTQNRERLSSVCDDFGDAIDRLSEVAHDPEEQAFWRDRIRLARAALSTQEETK